MEKIRINKYLANAGVASRREIDKWIEEHQIKVNGNFATSGEKVDDNDVIEIRGKRFEASTTPEKKVYFLLNKPVKVLSSSKDDRGRTTVVDLIKVNERIFPIGRLDFETEGAIILTNDGDLFNKVIHPRTEVFKDYIAEVKGFVDDKSIEKLTHGINLEDGMTLPAFVTVVERSRYRSTIKISIREGKNRQIRRMFEAVGFRIETLKREKIGKITLGDLKVGSYRALTKKELEYLNSLGPDEKEVSKEKNKETKGKEFKNKDEKHKEHKKEEKREKSDRKSDDRRNSTKVVKKEEKTFDPKRDNNKRDFNKKDVNKKEFKKKN